MSPEDSRRLEIVQNFTEDNMNKTAAFEDNRLKYYSKGNVVDYTYVTIAAVYMKGGVPLLGKASSMSRKEAAGYRKENQTLH